MIAAIGFGAWNQQSKVVGDYAPLASDASELSAARDASVSTWVHAASLASLATQESRATSASDARSRGVISTSRWGALIITTTYCIAASNPRSTN